MLIYVSFFTLAFPCLASLEAILSTSSFNACNSRSGSCTGSNSYGVHFVQVTEMLLPSHANEQENASPGADSGDMLKPDSRSVSLHRTVSGDAAAVVDHSESVAELHSDVDSQAGQNLSNRARSAHAHMAAIASRLSRIKASVARMRKGKTAQNVRQVAIEAWSSGRAGFMAGVLQVLAFMWLRTIMNYQYKYGGSFKHVLSHLWAEGGIVRLYQGLLPWGILQAPLALFGDTAGNAAALELGAVSAVPIPLWILTFIGSCLGAVWRIFITPVDTFKTALQTDGIQGWTLLRTKISTGGTGVLWYGWEATWIANVVGHYPWFLTLNFLMEHTPVPQTSSVWPHLMRHALIGFLAALCSDCISNVWRVIKTAKQTCPDPDKGYADVCRDIIKVDGVYGLLTRGLGTRICVNAMQGTLFTVIWKGIEKKA